MQKNSKVNSNKQRKSRLRGAYTKVSLMALLLIVSTYAWFTSQKDITLANLKGTVEVAENMEISLDAKTWKQEIDLSNAALEFETAQASRDKIFNEENSTSKSTALAMLPSQLLPVSAVGETGETLMPVYTGKATTVSLTDIAKCLETDSATGEVADNGYFAFDIYIKNTSEDGEDDVLQLNLNSAAQVLTQSVAKIFDGGNTLRTYIGDEASGLQNTVRVGLALYNGEVDSTSTQKEILESTYNATIQDIAIWEPNAKDHVEYIVTNNNKLVNGTDTDTDLSFDNGEEVNTYALNEDSVGTEIANVYDITTEGLGLQKTFKTDNTKNGSGEVVDYRIKSEDGKPLDIKNISETDFKIKSNKVSRLRVYVWLEGQDVDCINLASEGGGIELDLGLTKDDEVGDVLEDNNLPLNVEYEVTGTQEVKVTVRSEKELTLPDNTWAYEEVEQAASAGEVYQVASTEPVQLAATVENRKAIWKVFTGETAQNIEITSPDGSKNKIQFKIVYVNGTTPSMAVVKYDKVVSTTGRVTATIKLDKEIGSLPTGGWYYSNGDKTEISKVYDENTTENVTVTDKDGNSTTVEVKIENIVEQTPNNPAVSEFTRTVSENGATYYGTKINYPVDIDCEVEVDGDDNVNVTLNTNPNDSDWQIFYADGEHVYLIADFYVPNAMIPDSALTTLGMVRGSEFSPTYGVDWDYTDGSTFMNNVANGTYTITDSKYMIRSASAFTTKTNYNYQAVGSLLDTSIWKEIFANNSYAVDAIGGPTIEMWSASWNTVYDETNYPGEQIYCTPNANGIGYSVGNTDPATTNYLYVDDSNTMYVSPEVEDRTGAYWLASKSANYTEGVLGVDWFGLVSAPDCDGYDGVGLRPIVCLKSDVEATYNGTEWEIEGLTVSEPEPQVLVEAVNANKQANYGKKINYPVDIDVTANTTDSDWQIFYADEEHVYIIADDYIPNTMVYDNPVLPIEDMGIVSSNYATTYGMNWSNNGMSYLSTSEVHTISDSKYMIRSASTFTTKTNYNYQAAGSLLDTNIFCAWTEIFANNEYAVDAIGSPTLEMWVASWNESGYTKLEVETDSTGYYVGKEGNDLAGIAGDWDTIEGGYWINLTYDTNGYANKMYFPYTEKAEDETDAYWLSSPSAGDSECMMIVRYDGEVGSEDWDGDGNDGGHYSENYVGLRPVVCLETEVKATYNGTEWEIEGV